jgi:hypothetical protein
MVQECAGPTGTPASRKKLEAFSTETQQPDFTADYTDMRGYREIRMMIRTNPWLNNPWFVDLLFVVKSGSAHAAV